MTEDADIRYCREAVDRLDRDRALLLRLVPEKQQRGLAALFAFNLEVARVREAVSEAMLGEIRLQWWRDALAEIRGGEGRRHPVVQELARLRDGSDWPEDVFDALIDARARDLNPEPFATEAEREAYIDASNGGLLVLAGWAMGARGEAAERCLRAIGMAHGLTGMMRALPSLIRMNRAVFSQEALAKAGLEEAELRALTRGAALNAVVRDSVAQADAALAEARATKSALSGQAKPLLSLGAVSRHAADRLRKVDFDPYHLRMAPQEGNPPGLTLRLLTGIW